MLAVVGGKGGCGKTTTALGLAAALAALGRTPLVADTDRDMPNLHALADVDRAPGLDAVAAGQPAEHVANSPDRAPGVSVLPAPPPSTEASTVRSALLRLGTDRDTDSDGDPDSDRDGDRHSNGDRIPDGRPTCRPVVLDTPAGAGPAAALPLRVADRALLVTTPEPACLRDTAKTAAMARELDASVVGAVVTRVETARWDGEAEDRERDLRAGIAELLSCRVLATTPTVHGEVLADDRVRAAYDRAATSLGPNTYTYSGGA